MQHTTVPNFLLLLAYSLHYKPNHSTISQVTYDGNRNLNMDDDRARDLRPVVTSNEYCPLLSWLLALEDFWQLSCTLSPL